MDSDFFALKAKQLVMEYSNRVNEQKLESEDVYIVWLNKILQHNKAMLSTPIPDGRYYEVTYNGDKEEFYVDAYTKEHNEAIKK